jgi:hypothetical protein
MASPRSTTKFRLAAAALGGASRAEPHFPHDIGDHPIQVCISILDGGQEAPDRDAESEALAAAAARDAFAKERVFRVVDAAGDAEVVMTITRAASQPSFDFWETKHAHATLVVRRTGQVLDPGSDYVEGRQWAGVGSTLVFLAKLQCAQHYQAIVRSRTLPEAATALQATPAATGADAAGLLDIDPGTLTDDRLKGLLARLRVQRKRGPE